VLVLVIATAACSSTAATRGRTRSTAPPTGSPDSTYWVAGWTPGTGPFGDPRTWGIGTTVTAPGHSASDTSFDYVYADRTYDIDVSARRTSLDPASGCTESVGAHVGATRGHRSCEGPLHDEGQQYGWWVSWIERPGVSIDVTVNQPENVTKARPVAERVAASVRPITAASWARLATLAKVHRGETTSSYSRVVETAAVAGRRWTLTAQIPTGFPVDAYDTREPCAELQYGGESRTECAYASPTGGSRFARLAGVVFAFGSVPSRAHVIALRVEERPSNVTGPILATLRTVAVPPTRRRMYVYVLPHDNCGVEVLDVTTSTHREVGFAPSLPSDGLPCNHPLPGGRHIPTTTRPPPPP
jgi:hypothetical protein